MAFSHRFDPTTLREYDIRGIVGRTLSARDAFAIGRCFGSLVVRDGGRTVAVGRDGRLSGPELEAALVDGLTACGLAVLRMGVGPTPMLYYLDRARGCDGAIQVTGSHNPPDYNGFKMTLRHKPFFGQAIQQIGAMADAGDVVPEATGRVEDVDIAGEYVARILKDWDGGTRALKVVWDNGNGAAGDVLAQLVSGLPGEHTVLFGEIDGRFPNHHPDPTVPKNLTALIALADGGAIGRGGASRSYFGMFEGGVPQLAAAVGWFATQGGKTPDAMHGAAINPGQVLTELPSGTLVSRLRQTPTDYDAFIARFEDDAFWNELGYLTPADRFAAPALHINTWHDIAIRGTFEIADLMRRNATTEVARRYQPVIVGPGLHCDPHAAFTNGAVGDLAVDPAQALDFAALQRGWLDHWLRDGPAPGLAPYTYYVLGADQWQTASSWPPPGVVDRPWHLGNAGVLSEGPAETGQAQMRYDPASPTPSLGGPICCTGDPSLRAGPLDQSPNADRTDVLAYVSAPLAAALRIVGDARAEIAFSSDRPDTDLIAILVDVAPDGTRVAITQGALRLRYREGFDAPQLMVPGQVVRAPITFSPIAYEVAAGHRIGLHLSSSSFPRLERNLQTGGRNFDETEGRRARIRVHTGSDMPSRLLLFALQDD